LASTIIEGNFHHTRPGKISRSAKIESMRPAPVVLAALSVFAAAPEFRIAVPGYRYQFPRDHFDHPEFRTEWWYYTGNVRSGDGRRYGFELVFFRQAKHRGNESKRSVWEMDDLYLAHLALSDLGHGHFRFHERVNRAGPGIAGVSFRDGRIWNGNWEARFDKGSSMQTISAVADGIRLNLRLRPLTPPVIHGENGISRKGERQASYYVSFPLLETQGLINGVPVAGTAWMDHEWFTQQLAKDQRGWDWFSIQLENRTELMLFQLRHYDGTLDVHSAGTYISADGRSMYLSHSDFRLEPLEYWTSSQSGARYPIRWRISVPRLHLELECRAALQNQELTVHAEGVTSYWEGAVTYQGTHKGVGYLEMTGYARPVRL
jgi:predicted secreted hydrolase